MSSDRINELHEQASERYLNGDYAGAIEAWRDVLRIDPSNEEAQGGLRMAAQFIAPEPVADAGPAPPASEPNDLELGLKVLDGLDEPMFDAESIDGATDREPSPPGAFEDDLLLEAWGVPSPDDPADDAAEYEAARPMSAASAVPVSAAGAELKRRVDDLLNQAKAKAEAGERDEALAVLARLAILDEDNADAAALRAKIESEGASDLDKVERAIIEGVAAMEGGHLDDAERYFKEALAVAPHHREAKHYLEKIAERRTGGSEDLLGSAVGEAAPAEDAVAVAVPIQQKPKKSQAASSSPAATARPPRESIETPVVASSRKLSLPPLKVVVVAGVGLLVAILAIFMVPVMFGGRKPPPTVAKAPTPKPKAGAKAGAGSSTAASPAAPASQEGVATLAEGIQKGRERMAAGDFSGAVIAFNQALSIDPASAEARAGFEEAGERYKTDKAEREAASNIKLAFRDGEFTSALRLAYRLPPTIPKRYSDGVKLAGWYNLAVVALRSGDCKEALTHIGEALEISPADAEAKSLKELATRYLDAVKDRSFFDRVEGLAFRSVPEMTPAHEDHR